MTPFSGREFARLIERRGWSLLRVSGRHHIYGKPGAETRELAPGLHMDLDDAGVIVGLDIDQASRKLDLSTLETVALPFTATHAA